MELMFPSVTRGNRKNSVMTKYDVSVEEYEMHKARGPCPRLDAKVSKVQKSVVNMVVDPEVVVGVKSSDNKGGETSG